MSVQVLIDGRSVCLHEWSRHELGKRFYVYVLSRPCGEPFYVGMGTRRRIVCHEEKAKRGERSFKSRTIRTIWAAGGEVRRSILAIFNTRVEAEKYEVSLIAKYGRSDLCLGPLVNHTDGADGGIGRSISKAHRAAISRAFKGKKRPAHVVAAVIAAHTGARRSDEVRAKMREAWTPERKALHALMCKTRSIRQETRDAISRANSGRVFSREVIEKRAAKLRGRKQSLEQRIKSGAGVSKSWTPERRALQAERMRAWRTGSKSE